MAAPDPSTTQAYKLGQFVGATIFFLICIAIFGYVLSTFKNDISRPNRILPDEDEVMPKKKAKPKIVFDGERIPNWEIQNRAKATREVLHYLSAKDKWFEDEYLVDVVSQSFHLVYQAYQKRSLKTLEGKIAPELMDEFEFKIKELRKKHLANWLEKLEIIEVQIVYIEACPEKTEQQFTALIFAQCHDFFTDDGTGDIVEGSRKTLYNFQEFWTFRRFPERWKASQITASKNHAQFLQAQNVVVPEIFDKMKSALSKEIMLQVTTKIPERKAIAPKASYWDKAELRKLAKEVFLSVIDARETGKEKYLPLEDMTFSLATDVENELERQRKDNLARKYRDLEIISIHPIALNAKTQKFTAHITVKVQRVYLKDGEVTQQDPKAQETDFFWTFVYEDKRWKLCEFLNAEEGKLLLDAEPR